MGLCWAGGAGAERGEGEGDELRRTIIRGNAVGRDTSNAREGNGGEKSGEF